MPAKSAAAKKPVAKNVKVTKPTPKKSVANKNARPAPKVVSKSSAKAPVKKPVAKALVKKPVARTTVKAAAKTTVKAKVPIAKAPVKAAAKAPVKAMQKTPTKAVTQAASKAVAAKSSTKSSKPDLSVEEAVARVMGVVGKKETKATKPAAPAKNDNAAAMAVSSVATAKVATKAVAPKPAKNDNASLDYKPGDMVVYPAHGVGQVDGVETLTIGGIEVTLYTITFAKDRMRLKLPLHKIKTSGLRPLSTKDQMQTALQTMRGRARIKRVMWSRRAQEYEAKINSGSPVQVAEVLRDLRRNATGAENSYSERQIFQSALERLASELAAIEKIGEADAAIKLQNVLTEAA